MPELPEVETICRGLRDFLLGERVKACECHTKKLRIPLPQDLHRLLQGKCLSSVERRAKYILLHFEDGWTVIIHLGMSGTLSLASDPYTRIKHDHLLLTFVSGKMLVFNDPRRFGLVSIVRTAECMQDKLFRSLGVEPLDEAFDLALLQDYFSAHPRKNIKQVFLAQTLVVGVGNIYASEVLFCAGVHPLQTLEHITPSQRKKLVTCTQKIIRLAIENRGSSLRNYKNVEGKAGDFLTLSKVYGKAGEPCPKKGCTSLIRKIVQQGRSSFFCPTCQPID